METWYEGIPFSPETTLSSGIDDDDIVIPITDESVFPDAPNLATIGFDEDTPETILYEEIDRVAGELKQVTRAVEGSAQAWASGKKIARMFTAKDHDITNENIDSLAGTGHTSETVKGNTDAIGDRTYTEENYVTDSESLTASIDELDQQVKDNADGIGSRTYTEDNYVTDSESLTDSVDALDMQIKDTADELDTLKSDYATHENRILTNEIKMYDATIVCNSVSEYLLRTTNETTVLTFTPYSGGVFIIHNYFRVITDTTDVTLEITYTDETGAQTITLLDVNATAVGSYYQIPITINTTATAISVKVTAGTANRVYFSSSISGRYLDAKLVEDIFAIKHGAGLMDFSITNGDDVLWVFSDGSTSTADRPAKTLGAGTTYLYCSNFSDGDIKIGDNDTNAVYTGDLADLPALTYYLNLYNCTNITGDLADLPALTYYLNLSNCSLVTGDLADLPAPTYYLSLYNCSLVTGKYTQVSGNTVPTITNLSKTNISAADMDDTLIAYAATTKNNGSFTATGMFRTATSDDAVATLTGEPRNWIITGITKV